MLVTIEGIDGAGKAMQAKLLAKRLHEKGHHTVGTMTFPQYDGTFSCGILRDYLNGDYGPLRQNHPLFVSLLYALDRYESRDRLLELLSTRDFVICDRYVESNVAYQCSRLTDDKERQRLAMHIQHVEYNVFHMPRPALTIYLDVPADVSQKHTAGNADIYESNKRLMRSVRKTYEWMMDQRTTTRWCRVPVVVDELDKNAGIAATAAGVYNAFRGK